MTPAQYDRAAALAKRAAAGLWHRMGHRPTREQREDVVQHAMMLAVRRGLSLTDEDEKRDLWRIAEDAARTLVRRLEREAQAEKLAPPPPKKRHPKTPAGYRRVRTGGHTLTNKIPEPTDWAEVTAEHRAAIATLGALVDKWRRGSKVTRWPAAELDRVAAVCDAALGYSPADLYWVEGARSLTAAATARLQGYGGAVPLTHWARSEHVDRVVQMAQLGRGGGGSGKVSIVEAVAKITAQTRRAATRSRSGDE